MHIYMCITHKYCGFIVHINPIYMFTTNKYFLVDWFVPGSILDAKGMATHSSVLSWKTPWTEEAGRL